MRLPKHARLIAKHVKPYGWTVKMASTSHYRLVPPSGWLNADGSFTRELRFAGSPKDADVTVLRAKADLAKLGVV